MSDDTRVGYAVFLFLAAVINGVSLWDQVATLINHTILFGVGPPDRALMAAETMFGSDVVVAMLIIAAVFSLAGGLAICGELLLLWRASRLIVVLAAIVQMSYVVLVTTTIPHPPRGYYVGALITVLAAEAAVWLTFGRRTTAWTGSSAHGLTSSKV